MARKFKEATLDRRKPRKRPGRHTKRPNKKQRRKKYRKSKGGKIDGNTLVASLYKKG